MGDRQWQGGNREGCRGGTALKKGNSKIKNQTKDEMCPGPQGLATLERGIGAWRNKNGSTCSAHVSGRAAAQRRQGAACTACMACTLPSVSLESSLERVPDGCQALAGSRLTAVSLLLWRSAALAHCLL